MTNIITQKHKIITISHKNILNTINYNNRICPYNLNLKFLKIKSRPRSTLNRNTLKSTNKYKNSKHSFKQLSVTTQTFKIKLIKSETNTLK